MTELADPPLAVAESKVDRRRRISLIWLIPLVTALIGGYLAWQTFSQRGPTITITFQTAEGLIAGQSHVKHKDVDMGLVTRIVLTKDLARVLVTVDMTREAEPLLTDKAQFWVVRPRFFAGNLSGLGTLVSGSYIELLPSADGGQAATSFTGLEDPPVLQSDVPGRTFLLKAQRIGSINLGSPIYYRDLNVGEILGWDISDMADSVMLHAFIREPYDRFVRDNTRFWNASGVSVKLGADGVQVQLESLKALILGGIAFETPASEKAGTVSADQSEFTLYASQEAADAALYKRRLAFVSFFSGTVRGLAVGAPVTFHGIKIGQVTGVALEYDPQTNRVRVPVHFEVEPDRILGGAQILDRQGTEAALKEMVQRGLRAQLGTASLLTGQMLVSLDVMPNAPPAELQEEDGAVVLPTMPGEFDDLMNSATAILAKVNALPFDEIGKNLNDTLQGVAQVANSQALKQSLVSLQATLVTAQDTLKQVNAGLQPALKQLPGIAADLRTTLDHTSKLAGSLDTSYGGNSNFNRSLDRLMAQLNDTAQSLRVLADLLTRHPEALIRGRTDQGLQ